MNILQKAIRSMYSLTGSFNDKLLKYFKQYGATSSVLQDAEKQYLVGRLGAKYLTNQDYWKELDAQFGDGLPLEVSDILRKYGSDAHLYLPGIGRVNGFEAGNYFDSAGTTHASVDGSVGMVLDAAGSVGAELCALGPQTLANAAQVSLGVAATVGKTYKIYLPVGCYVNFGPGWTTTGGLGVGAYEYRKADGTNPQILNSSGEPLTFTPSVREVTGTHATQSTPGFKPTLRKGIVNLLTWSNDLTNAAWAVQGGATKSGQTLSMPAVGAKAYQISASQVGSYTAALVLSGSGTLSIHGYNATDGDIGMQQITLTATPTLYVTTFSQSAANSRVYFGRHSAGDTATSVVFGGAALFQGTLTAAQILAAGGIPITTTAPASSVAGPNHLEFKAANASRLQLGSVPFQMNEDHCVVIAARVDKLGGFNGLFVAGSSLSDFGPYMAMQGSAGSNPNCLRVQYKSTNINHTVPLVAGEVFVLTAWVVGGVIYARKNGVQFGTAAVPAYTATSAASIGALGNGSGDYLDGAVYDLSPIKGTLTLADVQLLEKQAAAEAAAGIQL